MTVMMRSFKDGISSWLTPEACERARKYLISVGYPPDCFKPIVWPDDAVSAHRDDCRDPWQFVTKGDIRRRRQKEAKDQLSVIREHGVIERRAIRLVVYYFPGYFTIGAFMGWYAALHGVNDFEQFLNFRCGVEGKIIRELMKLFPLVEQGLWHDGDIFKEWMKEFVEKYPIRTRRKDMVKVIGSAPVWVEMVDRKVTKILELGRWPQKRELCK